MELIQKQNDVEEKQKLYLNRQNKNKWDRRKGWRETKVVFKLVRCKNITYPNICWRETKVVFKFGTHASINEHKFVEEKQKLYLNVAV